MKGMINVSELKSLRYTIHHTGIPVNNPEDYDPAKYYNRSGIAYVDTLCDCKTGKGIHYYFDWYNDDGDDSVYCEHIEAEIKARFNNKFRFCDSCESEIMDKIKEQY